MTRRLLRLALVALLASCGALGPSPEWTPYEVPMVSSMRLWEVTRLAMEKNGFPVIHQGFDPKTRTAESGWDLQLHPFKGRGYRERLHVRYETADSAGKLLLSVRVEREVNQALAKPLDPSYAEWERSPDNTGRARVVLQYVQGLLGPEFEVGTGKDPRLDVDVRASARDADAVAPRD
jgi:hypothetical protein